MAITSAYTTVQGEAAAPETTTQEIIRRLNQLHDMFSLTTDRTQRVLDRAFGPEPEAANKLGNPRAVPQGDIGAIRERLDDLGALASQQQSLLNRLDTLV